MLKFNKETYGIFSTVSQIFELDKDANRHRTDDYSHTQLMLCEENSTQVITEVNHGMVYLVYTFKDESRAVLVVVPPRLPDTKTVNDEG